MIINYLTSKDFVCKGTLKNRQACYDNANQTKQMFEIKKEIIAVNNKLLISKLFCLIVYFQCERQTGCYTLQAANS